MAVSRPPKSNRLRSVSGPAQARELHETDFDQEALRRNLHAVEELRGKWARELHDDTLQALAALHMMLGDARRRDDLGSTREGIDRAMERLVQEIANLRSLIVDLRPAALDELGLPTALEALFERTREAAGVRVDAALKLNADARLDREIETVVYRVVQESLTNAARHARARRVEIDVRDRGSEISVVVGDDGRGFDAGAPSNGLGLTGMRERVALVGGQIGIMSTAAGTTVTVSVPAIRAGATDPAGPQAPAERPVSLSARKRSRRPAAYRDTGG